MNLTNLEALKEKYQNRGSYFTENKSNYFFFAWKSVVNVTASGISPGDRHLSRSSGGRQQPSEPKV